MNKYWNPIVKGLEPYVPGEQSQDLSIIKLNTNENPYPPSSEVLKVIRDTADERLRLYPDPNSSELVKSLATLHGVGRNNIFVGNGSDDVLAMTFMAFFQNTEKLLFPDITYSFYPVYCKLFNVQAKVVEVDEQFKVQLEGYTEDNSGILFSNPNAPTGISVPLQDIERLLKRNKNSVVVVDEAYVDFGGESAVALVGRYPNLLIIQTFSKSRSLAGLRIGCAIGNAGLIEALNRVKNSFNSYPLDRLAIAAATVAVNDSIYFNNVRRRVIETRESSIEHLRQLGFEVLPSHANFVFARHPQCDAKEIYLGLKKRGLLVRHFAKPRIDQFLRITIGTDEQMQTLFNLLPKVIAQNT